MELERHEYDVVVVGAGAGWAITTGGAAFRSSPGTSSPPSRHLPPVTSNFQLCQLQVRLVPRNWPWASG